MGNRAPEGQRQHARTTKRWRAPTAGQWSHFIAWFADAAVFEDGWLTMELRTDQNHDGDAPQVPL